MMETWGLSTERLHFWLILAVRFL
ncbi:hypothetical protein LINGRAPRIM_LOCUS1760 [Linum grandiflorum]